LSWFCKSENRDISVTSKLENIIHSGSGNLIT
jgi:hypothetical protein